jgi:hypothetical protein
VASDFRTFGCFEEFDDDAEVVAVLYELGGRREERTGAGRAMRPDDLTRLEGPVSEVDAREAYRERVAQLRAKRSGR